MEVKTCSEFIRLVGTIDNFEGQIFFEEWKKLATEKEEWRTLKGFPLSPELVMNLIEDMADCFKERISRICNEGLYELVVKRGHDFLREIQEKARQCGVGINPKEADIPLTITDAMIKGGFVKKVLSE